MEVSLDLGYITSANLII